MTVDLEAAEKLSLDMEFAPDALWDVTAAAKTIRDLVAEVRRLLPTAHDRSLMRVTVERDEARRQLAVAREALEWYAQDNIIAYIPYSSDIYRYKVKDHGERAREALAKLEGK